MPQHGHGCPSSTVLAKSHPEPTRHKRGHPRMAPPARSDAQWADAPSFSQNGASKLATRLMVGEASLAALVALAGLALLAAAWALLSPAHVFSRSMTWDLLFNLAGAWQLHFGHVPHVDFHHPVGRLNFWLTDA